MVPGYHLVKLALGDEERSAYNILGMISSQQNASPGQECRNTLDKARKLSLPGKAAELVDDIEAHRGIITR